mmetsp:Transcript_50506/g.130179  ORF Transcript_50506/g.130179 Transcript_50506/m.130179 type:complete len:284 (+) Transcript_50506:1995-2846(+)
MVVSFGGLLLLHHNDYNDSDNHEGSTSCRCTSDESDVDVSRLSLVHKRACHLVGRARHFLQVNIGYSVVAELGAGDGGLLTSSASTRKFANGENINTGVGLILDVKHAGLTIGLQLLDGEDADHAVCFTMSSAVRYRDVAHVNNRCPACSDIRISESTRHSRHYTVVKVNTAVADSINNHSSNAENGGRGKGRGDAHRRVVLPVRAQHELARVRCTLENERSACFVLFNKKPDAQGAGCSAVDVHVRMAHIVHAREGGNARFCQAHNAVHKELSFCTSSVEDV